MTVTEDQAYSRDYLDPRTKALSIANAVRVFFTDGTATEPVVVEYPIGHRRPGARTGCSAARAEGRGGLCGSF